MKKVLLMIGICCLAIGIANATPLTGGTYTIPSLTISSGGSNNLTGGTYRMVDIKGQSVIGSSTGGTYGLGLGGIYGEVVTREPEVLPEFVTLTDNGLIRNTVIERAAETAGSNIRIRFRSASSAITQANIYRLSGAGVSFSNTTPGGWTRVATNVDINTPGGTVDTLWMDLDDFRISDGKNAYYRVVPASVTDVIQIFGRDSSGTPYNERTVAKEDIYIQRSGERISYNAIAFNLLPQAGIILDQVFPPGQFIGVPPTQNILDADIVREWNGSAWLSYYKNSTANSWRISTTPADRAEYKFNQGYMIRLQPDTDPVRARFYVTVVGLVLPVIYQSNINYNGVPPIGTLGETSVKFTSFGNPFPKTASISLAFTTNYTAGELTRIPAVNQLEADIIRYWDAATAGWRSSYLDSDGSWKLSGTDVNPAFDLTLGTGYFFRKADRSTKGAFIWKY